MCHRLGLHASDEATGPWWNHVFPAKYFINYDCISAFCDFFILAITQIINLAQMPQNQLKEVNYTLKKKRRRDFFVAVS